MVAKKKKVTKKKAEKPAPKKKGEKKTAKKVTKKKEAKEISTKELPTEIGRGITESLNQVDVRDLLKHSGEDQQKTRAHLEEELAWQSWRPEEEEKGKTNVNYGGNNGSKEKNGTYEETNPNINPLKETYEAMNPYEAHDNFYDPSHTKVSDRELGQIRGTKHSELEIRGLSKKSELTTQDFTQKYPEENYD